MYRCQAIANDLYKGTVYKEIQGKGNSANKSSWKKWITLQHSWTWDSPALCELLRTALRQLRTSRLPRGFFFCFLSFWLLYSLISEDSSVAFNAKRPQRCFFTVCCNRYMKVAKNHLLIHQGLNIKWRSFPFNAWQRKNMLWSVGRGWKRVCMENVWLLPEAQVTSTIGIQSCLINCLNIIP